ncbi:tetratricopeptide repeat protein [Filomicrobium sp.]|uniref:O-linked N-acetylglucosamine transferase, SPINDLY family protein n=1 Tax=Filomicrobium sp. TaxID=2024831 RepID=UPI00258D9A4F|nr:tetratricopeptide repeat protein [Filomicrobium sp.]MCV0370485.1 tetratricopeptide repeat protein [Filomicrobium sp.]
MRKPKSRQQVAQLRDKAIGLHRRGDLRGAQAAYVKYLKLAPHDGEVLGYLAITRFEQGYPSAALDLMQRAINSTPSDAGLKFNYATMLYKLQRFNEAELILKDCLQRDPELDVAAMTLGLVLLETGRLAEAIDHFTSAAKRWPKHASMLFNLAIAFRRDYQFENAELAFQRACALAPTDIEFRLQFAKQLYRNKKFPAAIEQYSSILKHQPENVAARSGLMLARLRICDWTNYQTESEMLLAALDHPPPESRSQTNNGAPSPYLITLISGDASACFKAARAASHTLTSTTVPRTTSARRANTGKIRLAYVSADFREHATAYLISELIELHDREKFEVVGISYGPIEKTPMRQRMETAFDKFVDVSNLSSPQIAHAMKQLELDIAIDLQGFNQHNRMEIFAKRPAPIQVLYLGWPGTSGSACYDYVLADPIVIPRENAHNFAENPIWLPGPYQPNDRNRKVSELPPTRAECGLPDNAFVFSCFNNAFKITPEIFDVWMRILKAVPNSILWLLDSAAEGRENLREAAVLRGVEPERIVFAPRASNPDHLARHAHIDLVLDTLPYNAHTTASDALWMGIPILTCTGSSFAGRVATSLLTACQLPELITADIAAYENTAVQLAHNPSALRTLKSKLQSSRHTSALFDTPRTVQHVEHAYAAIISRHANGEPPSPLDLSSLN